MEGTGIQNLEKFSINEIWKKNSEITDPWRKDHLATFKLIYQIQENHWFV